MLNFNRSLRGVSLAVAAGLLGSIALVGTVTATHADAVAAPVAAPATMGWLASVNYFRAQSGLAPVTEDAALSAPAASHSCYMLHHGMSHDEVDGKSGYTAAGNESGTNSNVSVSSEINASAQGMVELWMSGPFHAIGILRPELTTVGFGRCDESSTKTWHAGATLDVIHGLGARTALAQPILFPGNGTTTNLDRFVVETPSPLGACGWHGSAGLPVLALLPESTDGATATITGPNGPLETCTVSGANTTGEAKQILDGDNAMVAIPRHPLADGTYHVAMHTNTRTVEWYFTVDHTAIATAA